MYVLRLNIVKFMHLYCKFVGITSPKNALIQVSLAQNVSIMKRIVFPVFLVLLFSCTKSSTETNSSATNSETIAAKSETMTAKLASDPALVEKIRVRCLGDCSNSQTGCGINWNIPQGTVECSCTGCTMEITNTEQIENLDKLLKVIGNRFSIFVKEHGANGIPEIKELLLQYDKINKTDLLTIEFESPDKPGLYETVLYAATYDDNHNLAKVIEIDCKGTCDCRERWVVATGSAECTCTGDCKMTVTTVEEN